MDSKDDIRGFDGDYMEYIEPDEGVISSSNVASATETTGAMQTPPQNGYEYSSYQEVVSMAIPKVAPPKEKGKKRLTESSAVIKQRREAPDEAPRA